MTIALDGRYILFRDKKVLCRPDPASSDREGLSTGWRLLSGTEVLQGGWHIERAVPVLPADGSVQVLEVRGGGEADSWLALRDLLTVLDETDFRLLGTAAQVLEWVLNHRYCGRCGHETVMSAHERAMHCNACGLIQYPRVSPCIIALVTRGDEILLARSKRFSLPIYSCLAGFIEAGESAEDAVHREILEESNLRVKNLRYQYSQPWPFPHQLMLGYFAEYDSGDIRIDEEELMDARWWSLDALPRIPPRQTIAGRLIRSYLWERNMSERNIQEQRECPPSP